MSDWFWHLNRPSSPLTKVVAPNAAWPKPNIRDSLTTGGKDRRKKMADTLAQLIGVVGTPGVLNQNPLNLPVGLDIQRKPRPTTRPRRLLPPLPPPARPNKRSADGYPPPKPVANRDVLAYNGCQ